MSLSQNTPSTAKIISSLHRANLQVISLALMLSGWSLLITYVIGYFISRDTRFINLMILQTGHGLLLTLAWVIQKRGQHTASNWLMMVSTFGAGILFNLFVEGLGLTLGILLAIVFSVIAWQTFPTRNAILAAFLSILNGALSYFIDANFAPGARLVGGFYLTAVLIIVGGIALFILIINGLRGIEFPSIGSQLRTSFLVVSLIPVLMIALFQTANLVNTLTNQARNQLLTDANAFASQIDSQLFTIANYIKEDAANPLITSALRTENIDLTVLAQIASRYPAIISYGLLSKNGFLIIDHRGNQGGNESATLYFKNAANIRITYISDVVLDEDTRRGVFFVSTPVVDRQGNLLGIIRTKISASLLQTIATDAAKQFGEGIVAIALDDANIILAHSANPELISKTLSAPSKSLLNSLQETGRLPFTSDVNAQLDDLARRLASTKENTIFISSILPSEQRQDYVTFKPINYKPWKILIAQRTTVFLAPAINQIFVIGLVILVLLAAVSYGANLTASLLVAPIKQLASTAQELGKGKLDTPISLPRKDELGTLAIVLDNTRQQIYELLQTLEQRVAERTVELTHANERNERRARQLETIAQVARAVTSLRDLNQLLPEITQQISESFGYYHAGIFLLDENREYAVLRAANSKGGQAMLARGHRLRVGRQGIVGNVTNTGRYRIALDVGDDATFFNNPDLPETRSEAALPLMIGDNIIGALDVQSTEPNAFNEDDIKALLLLSNQISIAIENARLFDETRKTLVQIQEFFIETSQSSWRSMVKEASASGYRYLKGNVEPLRQQSETQSAMTGEMLEIPILLRGEKLGVLKIRRSEQRADWSETEARMYQAIAERMAFALENARLFSDARRRANLERVAAEASTKISSSVRFETILRTAAEEISHLMEGSEVLIQIQPDAIESLDNKSNNQIVV